MFKMFFLFTSLFTFLNQYEATYEVADSGSGINILDPTAIDVNSRNDIVITKAIPVIQESTYAIYATDKVISTMSSSCSDFCFMYFDSEYKQISDNFMCTWIDYSYNLSYAEINIPEGCAYILGETGIYNSNDYLLELSTIEIGITCLDDFGSSDDFFENFYSFPKFVKSGYHIANEENYIYVKQDDLLTEDEIKSLLYLYDDYCYQKITFSVIENDYKDNEQVIGKHKVKIKATNGYDLEETVTLIVVVIDNKNPIITNKKEVSISREDMPINLIDILKNNIEYTDESDCTFSLVNDTQAYDNIKFTGPHYVWFYLTDSYGNFVKDSILINTKDDSAPIFYLSNFILTKNVAESLTNEKIINYINEYFSSIKINARNIKIIYNEYAGNEGKAGNYNINVSYDVDDKTQTDVFMLRIIEEENNNNVLAIVASSIAGGLVLISLAVVLIIRKRK